MIRVLIADDHPIVRRGLRQLITEQPDMTAPGEAADGHEVLRRLQEADWDALVLDLNMPGLDGLELLHEVKRLRPRLPVLVLSVHPEEQVGVRVLRAAAAGYLTKQSAADELVRAVRRVVAGGTVISPALAQLLADTVRSGAAARPHEALSDREFQVLRLLGAGATVSEIAARLDLSVKTISTYRARVLEKLGLGSTGQLMRYALRAGLVEGAEVSPDGAALAGPD
jgi:DNA-binding NarL/FixJ family response regulator